jgi:hypothetical protein
MSLFKNQIITIIATLENVTNAKSYNIKRWYKPIDYINCGFAACICGHQALAPDSEIFKYNKEQYVFDSSISNTDNYFNRESVFNSNAHNIAILLETSCNELLSSNCLAESIFDSDNFTRLDSAKDSCVFNGKELAHPHLNKSTPTIKDAISYLRLVLTKI